MKRLLIIFLLFVCSMCMGQVNLVMNPSLEQYSICPDRWDEIKYADFWMSLDSAWSPPDWTHVPWGVPEYFNACSHTGGVGVPLNPFCYQYPHSGNGMAFVSRLRRRAAKPVYSAVAAMR